MEEKKYTIMKNERGEEVCVGEEELKFLEDAKQKFPEEISKELERQFLNRCPTTYQMEMLGLALETLQDAGMPEEEVKKIQNVFSKAMEIDEPNLVHQIYDDICEHLLDADDELHQKKGTAYGKDKEYNWEDITKEAEAKVDTAKAEASRLRKQKAKQQAEKSSGHVYKNSYGEYVVLTDEQEEDLEKARKSKASKEQIDKYIQSTIDTYPSENELNSFGRELDKLKAQGCPEDVTKAVEELFLSTGPKIYDPTVTHRTINNMIDKLKELNAEIPEELKENGTYDWNKVKSSIQDIYQQGIEADKIEGKDEREAANAVKNGGQKMKIAHGMLDIGSAAGSFMDNPTQSVFKAAGAILTIAQNLSELVRLAKQRIKEQMAGVIEDIRKDKNISVEVPEVKGLHSTTKEEVEKLTAEHTKSPSVGVGYWVMGEDGAIEGCVDGRGNLITAPEVLDTEQGIRLTLEIEPTDKIAIGEKFNYGGLTFRKIDEELAVSTTATDEVMKVEDIPTKESEIFEHLKYEQEKRDIAAMERAARQASRGETTKQTTTQKKPQPKRAVEEER